MRHLGQEILMEKGEGMGTTASIIVQDGAFNQNTILVERRGTK